MIYKYFDTDKYALTKNDIWLRACNGQFELEFPMQGEGQYNEIKGEEKIRQIFDIAPKESFLEDISKFGYFSFYETEGTEENFSIEKEKIISFLKQKRPDHYRALVEAGVIME